MHLKIIELECYRGISKLPLPLDPQATVITGKNGAGKTAVLDGIATMLSWAVNRVKSLQSSGRPITETDILNSESHALLSIKLDFDSKSFEWSLSKTRSGHKSSGAVSKLERATEFAKQIQSKITESNEQATIPLFAYYPVNRAVLDIPLRIKKRHEFRLLEAWDQSLTSAADFRSFFEWFREREDLENEDRIRNPDHRDRQLSTVRKALEAMMPGYDELTVRRSPLRMTVSKNAQELLINQLSDGEKCLLALSGDLARRMAIANPGNPDPLRGYGIVLIDEAELHLHPAWQRSLMHRLTTTFPNCQFVISTHSPQIISEVRPDQVRMLGRDANGVIVSRTPDQTTGLTIDQILDELMSDEQTGPISQNAVVETEISELFKLIDNEEFGPAQTRLIDLTQKYHGSTPDLIRAQSLLAMLAPETSESQ